MTRTQILRTMGSAWFAAVIALAPAAGHAQDNGLAVARDLYASAAYDDALAMLNRLRMANAAPADSRTIEQYRAFCLLALGRPTDAERAIEAVVTAEPSFQPSESEVSPRVRTAFTAVRRRMLPAIIQQQYAEAKAAYDRNDFASAAKTFHTVVTMLADPDVASEATQSPLSDVRVLAAGFEELAKKASTPAPAPAPAPVVAIAKPAPPAPPVIYGGDEPRVKPPVAINQTLPQFPGQLTIPRSGKLEVVIDETGAVESATITATVTTAYDALALAATRSWRYRPATLDGAPVKFRKVVQITIKASPIR
jgi:Gram-negative bacterial TonB protein C-terminal